MVVGAPILVTFLERRRTSIEITNINVDNLNTLGTAASFDIIALSLGSNNSDNFSSLDRISGV